MFVSVPCSELCLGSTKAGRGCCGEQACCSALPAAQMQSLQRAAVCGVSALCSVPSRASGVPQKFCFRHWLSCSFPERSDRVTICASVRRQRAQQGRPQESKTPSAYSPALQVGHALPAQCWYQNGAF